MYTTTRKQNIHAFYQEKNNVIEEILNDQLIDRRLIMPIPSPDYTSLSSLTWSSSLGSRMLMCTSTDRKVQILVLVFSWSCTQSRRGDGLPSQHVLTKP